MTLVCLCMAAAIFTADIIIKKYIEANKERGCNEPRMGGLIIVRHSRNSGAVMNLFSDRPEAVRAVSAVIFAMVTVAFLVVLPKKGWSMVKFGLSLLVGGAAGNLYDRVKRGYVVDYFSFSFLKKVIFNISDIFVLAGALIAAAGAP